MKGQKYIKWLVICKSKIFYVCNGVFSYDFTVTVSKFGKSSEANVQVTLVDSKVPFIKISPFNNLVNPANKLTIRGELYSDLRLNLFKLLDTFGLFFNLEL